MQMKLLHFGNDGYLDTYFRQFVCGFSGEICMRVQKIMSHICKIFVMEQIEKVVETPNMRSGPYQESNLCKRQGRCC